MNKDIVKIRDDLFLTKYWFKYTAHKGCEGGWADRNTIKQAFKTVLVCCNDKICESFSRFALAVCFFALFMSAMEKTDALMLVRMICIGSGGQLHLVPSIIVFN